MVKGTAKENNMLIKGENYNRQHEIEYLAFSVKSLQKQLKKGLSIYDR